MGCNMKKLFLVFYCVLVTTTVHAAAIDYRPHYDTAYQHGTVYYAGLYQLQHGTAYYAGQYQIQHGTAYQRNTLHNVDPGLYPFVLAIIIGTIIVGVAVYAYKGFVYASDGLIAYKRWRAETDKAEAARRKWAEIDRKAEADRKAKQAEADRKAKEYWSKKVEEERRREEAEWRASYQRQRQEKEKAEAERKQAEEKRKAEEEFASRQRQEQEKAQKQQERSSGKLSVEQALEVLGLKAGATKQQINAAYNRLMKQVHPDVGGSDFFAKQLNAARAVLRARV